MNNLDVDTVLGWRGRTVRDADGEKVGKLGDLYLDETDRPAYAGVRTGLFGTHESIVPLHGMEERDGELVVPHSSDRVREAPKVDPDGSLSPEEEQMLAAYYRGESVSPSAGRGDVDDGSVVGGDDRGARADDVEDGRDRRGAPEGEMIRSEEEVRLGVSEPEPVERVRLKKVLVTENVEQTIPVRKEVVQLETEPPPEGYIESSESVDPDQRR